MTVLCRVFLTSVLTLLFLVLAFKSPNIFLPCCILSTTSSIRLTIFTKYAFQVLEIFNIFHNLFIHSYSTLRTIVLTLTVIVTFNFFLINHVDTLEIGQGSRKSKLMKTVRKLMTLGQG